MDNSTPRNQRAGILLFGGLFVFLLLANWFLPRLPTDYAPQDSLSIWILSGSVLSEVAILGIWTILGSSALSQRICFFIFAAIPMFASLLVGYLIAYAENENLYSWNVLEIYSMLSVYLVMQVAMMLPMLVMRWQGFVICYKIDSSNVRGFSIAAIFVATALVALFVMSEQSSTLLADKTTKTKLVYYGSYFALSLLLGVFAVSPVVWAVLRSRKLTGLLLFAAAILTTYFVAVLGLSILKLDLTPIFALSWTAYHSGIAAALLTFFACVTVFLIGLRCCGFRLVSANRI